MRTYCRQIPPQSSSCHKASSVTKQQAPLRKDNVSYLCTPYTCWKHTRTRWRSAATVGARTAGLCTCWETGLAGVVFLRHHPRGRNWQLGTHGKRRVHLPRPPDGAVAPRITTRLDAEIFREVCAARGNTWRIYSILLGGARC